ncbi:MAG TPA: sensor histidine kinase [Gemmatimonadaceae bacterium]|nr:sensor histidine kinase [Gemmatimonadaceae bacterium]
MNPTIAPLSELNAALLQAVVTLGIAALCAYLFQKYRRDYFRWLSIAWCAYALRIGCIVLFLTSGASAWLFAHQILTGWTALALLWSALAFSQRAQWRWWYVFALAFPVVWSYVAIYQLDNFFLAAGPAVLFLSLATLWAGFVFFKHWRATGSRGAALLAGVLFTWGVHHLDYPLLRARGAWNPWGYYLDVFFVLATSIGIVILVMEELDQGLRTLLAISGEHPPERHADANIDRLLERLNANLVARTRELELLSARMVQQHEEERRRVALALHDQTAQVWAAVKLHLGTLREVAPQALVPRVDRMLTLVDDGIRSIRSVAVQLRPPLLDELGLVPALRALVRSFAEQSELKIEFDAPDSLVVSHDVGLVLFRALQEALSNVVRHADASAVSVKLAAVNGEVVLSVKDNGRGFSAVPHADTSPRQAGIGLSGMRERIGALNGSVTLEAPPNVGASVVVRLPVSHAT